MARLSTHVLDMSRGTPAAGLVIELHAVRDGVRQQLAIATTNVEGRTETPLFSSDLFEAGIYELTFHAGEYFRRAGVPVTDPPFLGDIVVRVGLADVAGNYHIPLLLSPYGYSTYRGS